MLLLGKINVSVEASIVSNQPERCGKLSTMSKSVEGKGVGTVGRWAERSGK